MSFHFNIVKGFKDRRFIRWFCWSLLLVSCRIPGASDSSNTDRDTSRIIHDSGVVEELDCAVSVQLFESVVRSDTLVSMVPRLDWRASENISVQAVTDIGRDALLWGTPQAAASEGSIVVLGIPAMTPATVVLTAMTEQGLICSEEVLVPASSLPANVPTLNITNYDSDRAEGGYMSTVVITEDGHFVSIIDEEGKYVWLNDRGRDNVLGANFSLDGDGLIYMRWATPANNDADPPRDAAPGNIVRVGWDGEILSSFSVDGNHTDFVELPNGRIAFLGEYYRELTDETGESRLVKGDGVYEVSPDGLVTELWNVFDALDPVLDPYMSDDKSFTNANSLSYHTASDDLLVTISTQNSIHRFDYESGDTVWDLANDDARLSAVGDEAVIMSPHSSQLLDEETLLIFNRNYDPTGETPVVDMCSEAVVLDLDLDVGEAVERDIYQSEECLLVVFLGEAVRLNQGNTRVVYSSSGQIDEIDPIGDIVWQLNTDLGGAIGFVDWRPSLP